MDPRPLHFSLRRSYIDDFFFRHVPALPADSKVLDLGGTKIRKRPHFDIEKYGLRVVYANIMTTERPDVQADAARIPFRNDCFDAVICAELLEHLADPVTVLHESHRVLQAGGMLLMTVPFLFRIHADPNDYGRYTDHYWKENLEKTGFADIIIEKQGLFWTVLLEMLRSFAAYQVRESRLQSVLMRRIYTKLINCGRSKAVTVEAGVEQQHPFYSKFTIGYGITARKKN